MAVRTISRAQFDVLSPSAKADHVSNGGKLVDAFADHTPAFLADGLDRMRAGSHAEREWAARYEGHFAKFGFPQMRPTEKQEAAPATPSRAEVFALLLAGGSREGLPAELVEDFDRSSAAW
jgi:hypothetical protein